MDTNGPSEPDAPDEDRVAAGNPLGRDPLDERLATLLDWLLGSRTRARIFVCLRSSPGRTSTEIADETGLYPSTVRATVAAMHEEGILIRAKRRRDGRGNNPYEYRAVPPNELIGQQVPRIEAHLNAIYHIDRHIGDGRADNPAGPVQITVSEPPDD